VITKEEKGGRQKIVECERKWSDDKGRGRGKTKVVKREEEGGRPQL
jgi:hypothetical protein